MQSLRQNRQTVYYALYKGMQDILDANGKKTGEKAKAYTDPEPFEIYVSPNRGAAEVEQFGINENYTNVLSTFDKSLPVKSDSLLWIGVVPVKDENTGRWTPHTHTVIRVAKGLNSILVAAREVNSK